MRVLQEGSFLTHPFETGELKGLSEQAYILIFQLKEMSKNNMDFNIDINNPAIKILQNLNIIEINQSNNCLIIKNYSNWKRF